MSPTGEAPPRTPRPVAGAAGQLPAGAFFAPALLIVVLRRIARSPQAPPEAP